MEEFFHGFIVVVIKYCVVFLKYIRHKKAGNYRLFETQLKNKI